MADASFAKSLFFGVIAEETIVPYPVIARVEQDRTMALLDKTRKLGPKKLGMAFRGNLHRISDADYETIERLMRERA